MIQSYIGLSGYFFDDKAGAKSTLPSCEKKYLQIEKVYFGL